jgi:hypothetical protein
VRAIDIKLIELALLIRFETEPGGQMQCRLRYHPARPGQASGVRCDARLEPGDIR